MVKALNAIGEAITNTIATATILFGGVAAYMYYAGYITVTNFTKHITVITITY